MAKRDRPLSSTTKRSFQREERGNKNRSTPREDLTKFYGVQACLAIFKHRKQDIRRVFVLPELKECFDLLIRWCDQKRLPIKIVEQAELSKVAATEHHEGVCIEAKPLRSLAVRELLAKLSNTQRACLLVLEGVENPHNVGAILRTACFFGVTAVLIRSQYVTSLSGAACRVAEGAAEVLPIAIVPSFGDLFAALRSRGFALVATTPHEARSLYEVSWPSKVAILFGAEGPGLSADILRMADMRVAIPRLGPLESLNVGAAVASVLTEARREVVVSGGIKRYPPDGVNKR